MKPLLLLDDIFDKLDANRITKIFQLINSDDFGQVFITDTDEVAIDALITDNQITNYKIINLGTISNSRFVALKDVLDDMIREMRIGGKMDEMKVRKYWHELMGTYITNHTTRIFYKQENCLFIWSLRH